MLERKYIPRSENTYSTEDKMLVVSTKEKGGDLQVGNLKQPMVGECTTGRQPSMVEYLWRKAITTLFGGPIDAKCPGKPAAPYSIEKEVPCEKQVSSVTVTTPIFETKKDGTGRLTVRVDYNGTADDIDMTPAGVYEEDPPHCEWNSTRPAGHRKRGKHQSKGTRQSPSALGGCSENTKGGCKSRQAKKRYNLRMDIMSDSLDDCYGYDYREAEFEDALDGCSVPSNLSPSSLGSVSSFHDALQDALVMEAYMQESFGAGSVETSATPVPRPQETVTRRCSTTLASIVGARADEPKCDIDTDLCGFVVWPWRCSDRTKNEDDEENNSDGVTEDEFDYEDEECGDADDVSVVFCEELDDFDDSNSSSGFEEKKVRFNMTPAVHVMRAWDFAYRQARKGDWEMAARDRERFRKRIDDLEPVLGPALQSTTRDKIYAERFSSTPDATASRTSENPKNAT